MADRTNDIDRQAAEWFAKTDGANPPPDLQQQLDAWFAEDDRHRGAYLRAQTMMAHVEQYGFTLRARFNTQPKAVPLIARRRALIAGAAAAFALVAVFAEFKPTNETTTNYATAVGERRFVKLTDGSSVTLNTDTRLAVRYGRDARRISLDGGEAVFRVAKDEGRPFEVMSRGISIRAVGTKFAVRSLGDQPVEVRVLEGIVRVEQSGSHKSAELRRNMCAVLRRGSSIDIAVESPQEIQQDLAWRDGYIVLRHLTVEAAAQEFARYNKSAIKIEDPYVAKKVVTGTYAINDPRGFAKAVALAYNLDVSIGKDQIQLTRKEH